MGNSIGPQSPPTLKTIRVHPSTPIVYDENSNLTNFKLPSALLTPVDSDSTLRPSKTSSNSSFALSKQSSLALTEPYASGLASRTSSKIFPPEGSSWAVSSPLTPSHPTPSTPSAPPSTPAVCSTTPSLLPSSSTNSAHDSPCIHITPDSPSHKPFSSPSTRNSSPTKAKANKQEKNKVLKQINDNPVWNFLNGSWFGTASVNKNTVLSPDLVNAQLLCQENSQIRLAFLDYICDRKWLNDLGNRLDLIFSRFNANNNHYLSHSMSLHREDIIFNDFIIHGHDGPGSDCPNIFPFDRSGSFSNERILSAQSSDSIVNPSSSRTEEYNRSSAQPQNLFAVKKSLIYQKFNSCTTLKVKDFSLSAPNSDDFVFGVPKQKAHFLMICVLWTLFQISHHKQLAEVSPYFASIYTTTSSSVFTESSPQDQAPPQSNMPNFLNKPQPIITKLPQEQSSSNVNMRSTFCRSENERVKKRIRENLLFVMYSFTRDDFEHAILKTKWHEEALSLLDTSPFSVCIIDTHPQADESFNQSKNLDKNHPLMKIKSRDTVTAPIVYVNKPFERSTLFEKSDVISKDFIGSSVLFPSHLASVPVNLATSYSNSIDSSFSYINDSPSQNPTSFSYLDLESDQYQKLSYAIQNQQSIKLLLTSTKKNGDSYYNLLTSRPLPRASIRLNSPDFERSSERSLNLFVYYDINSPDASLKEIRHIDDFITLYSLALS